MQMLVQMGGSLQAAPCGYCLWLTNIGGIYWLINAIIHIEFTPRLKTHATKWWPLDEAKKPKRGRKCSLNRADMKTQEEYDQACAAVSKSLHMTAEWVDSRAPKDAFVTTEPEIQNRFHTKPATEGDKCCSLS